MRRGRLFVAYHYTGTHHNKSMGQDYYQGFGNMVGHKLMYAPQDKEMLEALEEECVKHCCSTNGFDDATCTVLSWQVMDGD